MYKMFRTQCVLGLMVLYVGLVQSWDVAVSVGDQIIFYTNGTEINTVNLNTHNLTALAYDEVHNMMLYVDKQSDSDAICGYNLHSMENKCFIKRVGSNIDSIAFDPATDTLFFTDINERSINWVTIKSGSNNNVYGNLLIKMDDQTPSDIAVDSCRGYIYWTKIKIGGVYMERARFNGSKIEVLNTWLPIFSLTVDPQTREIHYFDGCEECLYEFLEIVDLDGQNNRVHFAHLHLSAPRELTISKDYLYWMNSSESYSTVWYLPKNAIHIEPKEFSKFYNKKPFGIATNYKIKDQVQDLQDCEELSSLIPTITVTNNSLNIQQTIQTEETTETEVITVYTTVAELFCVHGMKVSETSVCKCTPGYIGERCDISVCENYCLQGDCSFNEEGLPKCRCNAGYSGKRCDVYACHGFCLNNGDCSLNDKSQPVCQCKSHYIGDRCEVSDCHNYCIQGECSFNEEGLPKCRCNAGFSGERCQVYACYGYCLNEGDCFLNENDDPVCQCVGNYEGTRCEAVKDVTFTFTDTPTYYSAKRNLTVADLLSNWRKPTAKVSVIVEL